MGDRREGGDDQRSKYVESTLSSGKHVSENVLSALMENVLRTFEVRFG